MENPNNNICLNCKYYFKHYVKWTSGFRAINFGHCIHTRIINTTKERTTCKYRQEADRDEFAEKVTDNIKSLIKRLNNVCQVFLDEKGQSSSDNLEN